MKRQKVLLVWNEAYSNALFRCLSERKSEREANEAARREIERARAEEIAEQDNANAVNGKGVRS